MPKIILTKNQWARLSEILGNLGLVFFASVVLPYVLDKPNFVMIINGLVLMFASWLVSLYFESKS